MLQNLAVGIVFEARLRMINDVTVIIEMQYVACSGS